MKHFLRGLVCVWLLTFGLALPVAAQEETAVDESQWERIATQAEAIVDNGGATDAALAAVRADIVAYREVFDVARGRNAARITTVREQIAALGAAPTGDGATPEAPEVAAARDELTTNLNTLLAPVQRAESAYLRADNLIAQIDSALREEQTRRLLSTSPSPLNPVNWPVAANDLRRTGKALMDESRAASIGASGQKLRESLPVSLLTAVLGIVLILRGRRWSVLIVDWLRRYGARGFGIWQFVISLLRVALPLAGIALLLFAVVNTGLLGPRMRELAGVFFTLAAITLGFRWVSERVFAREDDVALLRLPQEDRKRARLWVTLITLMVVISGLLAGMLETGNTAPASLPVVAFPFFVAISFALLQLGLLLRRYRDVVDTSDSDGIERTSTLSRVARWLGTGAVVVACVSPLMMAAGYYDLAAATQRPYVLTLALLGLILALQRFLADIYGVITGQGAAARDALIPVLMGLVLTVCSLPALALIWGARLTDLSELWATFSQGFSIGDSRISPTDFLAFVVIFALGYMITRLLQGALRGNVLPKTKMDIGAQNAIVSGLGYVGIFLAALAAITGAGLDLSSLAIVAGALSVGIGFGLQNIVSNFVSGIILLIERPISEGDWIEVSSGQMGYVRDISVRSTRIETFDRTDVIVPNADLVSGTVTNYTRGNTVGRVIVPVGVAYGTDTKLVDGILREIAMAQPMVLAQPAPNVFFIGFGADALDFEIRCFLRDVNFMMVVKNDINHAIAARFAEEGIEIPFAQRDLWLRNPETLHPKPAAPAEEPST